MNQKQMEVPFHIFILILSILYPYYFYTIKTITMFNSNGTLNMFNVLIISILALIIGGLFGKIASLSNDFLSVKSLKLHVGCWLTLFLVLILIHILVSVQIISPNEFVLNIIVGIFKINLIFSELLVLCGFYAFVIFGKKWKVCFVTL